MILIFEGADATGKTTHAEWLAARLGGTLLHYGPPDADALDMYVARPARWVRDEVVIMDRSSFGSMVWSRVGFHPPTMTAEVMNAVARWYAGNEAAAHIVIRDPDAITATLVARHEDDHIGPALAGQVEYLHMVVNHEILYIPVSLTSSDLLHHERNH